MPVNLLGETVYMNYMYIALMTYIAMNPSILKTNLTKYTPIIKSCDHSGWDDYRNDGQRYIFVSTFTIEDFLLATPLSISRGTKITNGELQHNYNHPLVKTVNGVVVPVTLEDIMNDPASKETYSNQYGRSGNSLYDYALKSLTALCSIVKECPVDMRLVKYNHPIYYLHTYHLLDGNGRETTKKSVFGLIKYKSVEGNDMIFYSGTPVVEYLAE
jgi:hypothetical protein